MIQLLIKFPCLTHLAIKNLRMTNLLYGTSSLSQVDKLPSVKSLYLSDVEARGQTEQFNEKNFFQIISTTFPSLNHQLTISHTLDQHWIQGPIPDLKEGFESCAHYFSNMLKFRDCNPLNRLGRHVERSKKR